MLIKANAVDQLKKLNPDNKAIRISVVGGGCSGMSYKMEFVSLNDDVTPDDRCWVENDSYVLIDKKSWLFLEGVELDFNDGLNGKGFEFTNPKAKRTFGCGSSFSA
jgi:iron-sulfur cluster assembly protein